MATEKSAPVSSTVKPPKPAARAGGDGPPNKAAKYLKEVQDQLKKTNWPTKPELIAQTQVVLGVLVVIGVFIAAWDKILGLIFSGVLRLMGVNH